MLTAGSAVFAQAKALTLADILIALRSKKADIQEKNRILTEAVNQRGITFAITPDIEKELDATGADIALIGVIRTKSVSEKAADTAKVQAPVQIASTETKPLGPKPDYAFYRNRATAALAMSDLEGALVELGKAIELKPQDPVAYSDRGDIYSRLQRWPAAAAQYSLAVEKDPKDTRSWYRLGAVSEQLNKQEDAFLNYQKAVEADPNNDQAKAGVARLKDPVEKVRAARAAAEAAAAKPEPPPVTRPVPVETKTVSKDEKKNSADDNAQPANQGLMRNFGALNEYATRLAVPVYSLNDRRMGLQGKVTVSVWLDADGNVTKVDATDGPAQLRRTAEDAARRSKFRPILVDGTPQAVTGYIVYNFVAQ